MKRLIFVIALSLSFGAAHGQTQVETLIETGIRYHDNGMYEKAIETYEAALKIDPKYWLAYYEIGLSYYTMGDLKNAIKFTKKSLTGENWDSSAAYNLLGSAYSSSGDLKNAEKILAKGTEQYPERHLLPFNLAIVYEKQGKADKAEDAYRQAIIRNPGHASSHLGLARIMRNEFLTTPSVLGYCFFLMLEPQSDRAQTAYSELFGTLFGNISREDGNINLNLSALSLGGYEFATADMLITLTAARMASEENSDGNISDKLTEIANLLFPFLGHIDLENSIRFALYRDLYYPFFANLYLQDHTPVFCRYISMSSDVDAAAWLDNNYKSFTDFAAWCGSYDFSNPPAVDLKALEEKEAAADEAEADEEVQTEEITTE